MATVIQLTRTTENRRVILTLRFQPLNTCPIRLNTDHFLIPKNMSRPTLKVYHSVVSSNPRRKYLKNGSFPITLLTALDCFQNQVLPFIHSFIQQAALNTQTPTPCHALCQELGIKCKGLNLGLSSWLSFRGHFKQRDFLLLSWAISA